MQLLAHEAIERLDAIGPHLRVVKTEHVDLRKRADLLGRHQVILDGVPLAAV